MKNAAICPLCSEPFGVCHTPGCRCQDAQQVMTPFGLGVIHVECVWFLARADQLIKSVGGRVEFVPVPGKPMEEWP